MTFFSAIRSLFGGRLTQQQVDGINRLLAITEGLPLSHRAYILATAQHETGGWMQPIREAFGETDAQTVKRLDKAWSDGRLGQVRWPYWRFDDGGKAWFGRGYVQITHRENYAQAGERLGVDLLGNPSAALNAEVAGKILVRGMTEGWFTDKKLSDYLPGDYVNARRIVNGTDRATSIARLARGYESALESFQPQVPKTPLTGLWAALWALVKRILSNRSESVV